MVSICGPINFRFDSRCLLSSANEPHRLPACIPFDAHCCHLGTAIKHPVPDRVKPSFVIFDIWAL